MIRSNHVNTGKGMSKSDWEKAMRSARRTLESERRSELVAYRRYLKSELKEVNELLSAKCEENAK